MIHVVTTALVRNIDHEVWLMRRTAECRDEHGCWDTCTGMLDEGWRAEGNMRRELQEELGLPPERGRLRFIGHREVFRPENAVAPHCVTLDFMISVPESAVRIAEPRKFSEGGWFTLGTLPSPLHSQVPGWLGKYGNLVRP